MCGIAGIVEWGGRPVDPHVLSRMCRALRHRGPDAEGTYLRQAAAGTRDVSIGLGHTRLSIIDLAGGHQPLSTPDERLWLVFNGEIYNYQALRDELTAAGYTFRTRSDTEVILQAYAAYGAACVTRLRGMFAFGLWDGQRRRLLLARDRVGKKPLVYAQHGDHFAFASELQALRQDPALPSEVNWEAVHHYLTLLCIPSPWTAFTGVAKLPPGHLAIVEDGQVRVERYWAMDPRQKRRLTAEEALGAVREHLQTSIRLRLVSDVPVGAFLSGGIDSSIIVGAMAAAVRDPVRTFSIGFAEAPFNELLFARQVAQRYQTQHTEFVVQPDAAAVMPHLIRHYGEPFADSSAIPTYYVAQCARQFVKVVLSGDGGDELFGGYYRHWAMQAADRYGDLPTLLRQRVLDPVIAHWPAWLDVRQGRLSLGRFLAGVRLPRAERWLAWMEGFDEAGKRQLYVRGGPMAINGCQTAAYFRPLWQAVEDADGVDALTWVDFHWYLPSDVLTKVDIASMAHGLEVRCPWLDHELIELAMQLPSTLKVRGRTLKYLLRWGWRDELPPSILHRRKQGFAVPLASWLRGSLRDWMEELLRSPQTHARRVIAPPTVERLIQEHVTARRDWSQQLWALMMLELWFRTMVDSRQEVGVPC